MASFVRKMPKLELHAHINGSVSDDTVRELVAAKMLIDKSWKGFQNCEVILPKGVKRNLADAFRSFELMHELCDNEKAAYIITKSVIKDFAIDQVKYVELRTTPRAVDATNMTKESYLTSVLNAIKENENDPKSEIVVRLLLSIDRRTSLEDAWDTLNLADKLIEVEEFRHLIVGLDLSGDPSKADASMFLPVFVAAKRKGFRLALHLSEIEGLNIETEKLLHLPPDRIGHGTYLHPECGGTEQIVQTIQKLNIPIEFCFTSNITTGTVTTHDDHHFGYWHKKGHPCLICTDDKGVFATDLSHEYSLAASAFNLSEEDLWNLSYNSIAHIFATDDVKEMLRNKFLKFKSEHF